MSLVTFAVAAPPPPDTTSPTVAVTAPAAGASVGGTVNVTAAASDDVGVAGVQFLLDGGILGAEDTSAPYSVSWATTATANGAHATGRSARDAAGNTTTSAVVAVTVSQPAVDPTLRVAYGFNETTGTVAADRSTNANNATVTSGTWVAGRFGNGLGLNGTSTRARAGSNVALSGSFTIEALGAQPGQQRLRDDRHHRDEPGPLPRASRPGEARREGRSLSRRQDSARAVSGSGREVG